mmetsp:Transcript_1229/g.2210  ORF Transcript_1229/g.2210 Transcript_1229/m.2210 type:complete len:101 (+) Transcript_1229:64-366(+)
MLDFEKLEDGSLESLETFDERETSEKRRVEAILPEQLSLSEVEQGLEDIECFESERNRDMESEIGLLSPLVGGSLRCFVILAPLEKEEKLMSDRVTASFT